MILFFYQARWKGRRQMRTKRSFGVTWLTAALLLLLLFPVSGFGKGYSPCNNQAMDLKSVVDAYAGSAVADGTSIGVAVAVVLKIQEPRFFSYGLANFSEGTPVTRDTIFQLGSVTKIFTTALLGEQVSRKRLRLDQHLSDFGTQLATLKPLTSQVTLKELGDFTGGFRTHPPTQDKCCLPGALPGDNERPTICDYSAQDLVTYFQNVEPSNEWEKEPDKCDPEPAPSLPANYNYSDISTGLIGLLLGGNPHQPLSNQALQGWYELVNHKIKVPLSMHDTILYSPDAACLMPYATATPGQKTRLAAGYGQALATAKVDDEASGQISKIDLDSGGFGYLVLNPLVTILGGGGSGATAHAEVTGDNVDKFVVDNPGSGYLNPPVITFTGGGSSQTAQTQAIIKNGEVVAIRILNGGSGYQRTPQAAISGGTRGPKTRSAVLGKVFIANGSVYYVKVTDGGKGYVDPLTVIVEAGAPATNNIPIWAPAGSLWSTTRDMIKLAQVALGDKYVGGRKIDPHLVRGFQIAQKPYACSTPDQSPCIDSSGLAWAITRGDGGLPTVISKNGGIEGASTEIRLVPAENFAVVVLTNSRQNFSNTGKPSATAANISDNIVAAIVRQGLSDGKGWGSHH